MKSYYTYKIYPSKNQQSVAFFFPAGFTALWQYFFVIQWLRFKGVTVVGFQFAWKNIISDFMEHDFMHLVSSVKDEVQHIAVEQLKVKEVVVLGASAGSFFGLHAAKTLSIVSSIVLFQPWGRMSHLFWHYEPLSAWKERVAKTGIDSKEKLDQLFASVDPQTNLSQLTNKDVIVFTSVNDRVITDAVTMESVIGREVPHATLHKSYAGHMFGIASSMMSFWKWMPLFSSDKTK